MDAVLPMDRATVARAAVALQRAFMDDPVYAWIWPDPAARARGLNWLWATALEFGRRYARARQTDGGRAASIWLPPGTDFSLLRMVRVGLLAAPLRMGLRPLGRFGQLNSAMERVHRQHMPGPHWYLTIVAVDPGLQGQGRGSALIADGLAQADGAHLPCYLETGNPRSLPLYERHGFRTVATASIGDGAVAGWAMVRDAASPGAG